MEDCETCKFWNRYSSSRPGELPNTGACRAAIEFWVATDWDRADPHITVLRPEYSKTLMFTEDASEQHAALKTMFNFGCKQHELIGTGE